ncbi:c2H2-type domain-containing protein [Nephila pilipes]|uniref:C2H2-type domain-containing protein n=1 Tax=Nephila pilipes TaxID=299642 RepID=A0A8X6PMG9_NEPPI|nr:c2H2-type domain-containing protein [Nephila pilipes]
MSCENSDKRLIFVQTKNRSFSGLKKQSYCEKCGITFGAKKSLYVHVRKFHPAESRPISGNLICGICSEKFRLTVNLNEHLQNVHNIELKFSNENFYSEDDFLNWKEKTAKESVSSFTIKNSYFKEDGLKLTNYVCNRSGAANPELNRTRMMKASGSVKCGYTCPAMMAVSRRTIDQVTEISVQYQSVHVGHNLDAGKFRLTSGERSVLASSLELGIPMTKILDKTKEVFSPSKRFGLITRKDLYNVRRDFILKKDNLVQTSMKARKNNLEQTDHNLVIDGNQEIENETIVSTLHNVSLESERNDVLTALKNIERHVNNLTSIDKLRDAKKYVIALETLLGSSITTTNLSNSLAALPKGSNAPSNKNIKRQSVLVNKKKRAKQNRRQ